MCVERVGHESAWRGLREGRRALDVPRFLGAYVFSPRVLQRSWQRSMRRCAHVDLMSRCFVGGLFQLIYATYRRYTKIKSEPSRERPGAVSWFLVGTLRDVRYRFLYRTLTYMLS